MSIRISKQFLACTIARAVQQAHAACARAKVAADTARRACGPRVEECRARLEASRKSLEESERRLLRSESILPPPAKEPVKSPEPEWEMAD
ncbi:hypothetical protein JL100_008510 [Skermanella mucosa]|uniref:hypothetical protein n=1 Tax=Skermanella mucosa TaxID=1789672 RepID=UPI00192C3032|nr:hypothetical protein [Skermanella mucosa]UEM22773.1 hypothetical protein JL100_008510 [Skermanella mucosa]